LRKDNGLQIAAGEESDDIDMIKEGIQQPVDGYVLGSGQDQASTMLWAICLNKISPQLHPNLYF
jgi:hypothetical protein